jgi:DNA-binding NarL/FixJ family response regulator
MTRVVGLVDDLMDRSRLAAAIPDLEFVASAAGAADADVVVVDLAKHADALGEIRAVAPAAFVVAFGPHVDTDALAAARGAGADAVLPRSQLFRDPAAAVTQTPDQ